MAIDQHFNQALQELVKDYKTSYQIGDHLIHMHMIEGGSIVSLYTPVYQGSGYLPEPVRKAMNHSFPQMRSFHSELRLDEPQCSINLYCRTSLEHVSKKALHSTIEEFASIAKDWSDWFDDHDKKERIYVRKKP